MNSTITVSERTSQGDTKTHSVISSRNCFLEEAGAEDAGNRSKIGGSHVSIWVDQIAVIERKIDMTSEVESSGKSPTRPVTRQLMSSNPSLLTALLIAEANIGNDGGGVGEGTKQSWVTMMRNKSKAAKMISECTRLNAAIVALKAKGNAGDG